MSQPPSAPPPPPPPEYGGYGGYGGEGYGGGGYGGQDPYGQPYQPGGQTSTKAIVALVLGIVGLFFCGLFVGIAALIVGRGAVRQIDESGGRLTGRGMATAGWVLGLIDLVLNVIGIIYVLLFVVGSSTTSSG
jgi:hypothetical protein